MYSRKNGHDAAPDAPSIPSIVVEPPPPNETKEEFAPSPARDRSERVVWGPIDIPSIVIEPPPLIDSPKESSPNGAGGDANGEPAPPAIIISEAPEEIGAPASEDGADNSTPAIVPKITIEPPPKVSLIEEERGRQLHARPGRAQRRHSIHEAPRQPAPTPDSAEVTPAPLPRTPHPVALQPEIENIVDKTPKGWRMRTRVLNPAEPDFSHKVDIVYVHLFNSPKSQKASVQVNTQSPTHQNVSENSLPEMVPSLKRAKTLMDEPSNKKDKKKPILPSFVPPAPATNEVTGPDGKKPRNSNALLGERTAKSSKVQPPPRGIDPDWLTKPDMLPKHLPNSRIIKVAFDINPALHSPLNFAAAGAQLAEYLQNIQKDSLHIPTVFLGHSYGGVFLIQTLVDAARTDHTSQSLLNRTAGVFLLSCTNIFSSSLAKLVAEHVSEKPSAKLFTEMACGMPALNLLASAFKSTVFDRKPPKKEQLPLKDSEEPLKRSTTPIRLGFPVVRFISREEKTDSQNSRSRTSSEFLKLPSRTILLDRSFHDALRFSGPDDPDFLRIMMLIQSGIRCHTFLHTVAFGDHQDLRHLMNKGFNVNIRDRWNQSALHLAVQRNNAVMVRVLVREGRVHPNIPDDLLNTPLHYAVRNGNASIVLHLLQHGADINVENQRKRSPKDLANRHGSRKRIADILKSQLVDGPNQTAFDMRLSSGTLPTSAEGKLACRNFQIFVTEIFASAGTDQHWTVSVSVQELLYSSSTIADILHSARPDTVKKKTPLCVWIHVPENNMIWIEDLFSKLRIHPAIWHGKRGMISESLRNRTIAPHVEKGDISCAFMPYLSYETNARQAKRIEFVQGVDSEHRKESSTRRIIEQHIPKPSLYPESIESSQPDEASKLHLQVPTKLDHDGYPGLMDDSDDESDISTEGEHFDKDDIDEEEKALVKTYLHNPAALHVRRTLDQYYYHMLESTTERDEDQVVSRWARTIKKEFYHNVLMVDQLWLWTARDQYDSQRSDAIGSPVRMPAPKNTPEYVISSFPDRTSTEHSNYGFIDDLRATILSPEQKRRDPIRQTEDLVSRILETCFNIFDRLQKTEMLRFFNIFEDSIGTVDDKETRLFQDFQQGSTSLHELKKNNKYFDIKKRALLEQLLDIREEIKLLVEVKDIRDEINIILSVLQVQLNIAKRMREKEPRDLLRSSTVERLVEANIDDFNKLDNQAKTTQDKLNTLMDLKQKAANAWEAREAREAALETGRQGNTMLVFTIVTIVFLPLSFMSSFFAIGVASFPKDPTSGETNWPLGLLSGIMFGISLSVSIPFVIFALNMQYFTAMWNEIRHNHGAYFGARLLKLFPRIGSPESFPHRKSWSQRLQQHRDEYLEDMVPPHKPSESNASNEYDLEGSTIAPTTSFSMPSAAPTFDTEDGVSRRFRFRRNKSGPRRVRDEEAADEDED